MLGEVIARRREELGLSQDDLARRLCAVSGASTFTRNEVSRYERGVRSPRGRTLEWLAEALECAPADLRSAVEEPGDPVSALAVVLAQPEPDADEVARLAYAWRAAPAPQITHTRAGRHIGERLVDEIEARTHDLRLMDDYVGGRELDPVVSRELRLTVDLVRDASYTGATGRRLLAAVSDLAQVAGWVASDAGDPGRAARYYLAGVQAGHAAAEPDLAASSLSSLAYQTANGGDRIEAVLMASAALRGAPDASPVARALLAERLAWAHGRVGDPPGATQALHLADELYASQDGDGVPAWAYWLNADEMKVMRGRVAVELHHADTAVDLLASALDRYPADHHREVTLYRSYLAEALILAGDRTEARRVVELLDDPASARSDERTERVRHLLAND